MIFLCTDKGREITCQLDKLPALTEWLNDKVKSSSTLAKVYNDLKVFVDVASNEKLPIEDRRAFLNVVLLIEELSTGKYALWSKEPDQFSTNARSYFQVSLLYFAICNTIQ